MLIHRLEIFSQVYECKSFSRAAEALDISQPTVSVQIKALEETLGVLLFNRLGRTVEPTDAGRYLHEHSQPLLRHASQLSEKMSGFQERLEGTLQVGASTIPGEYLLPKLLGHFQHICPRICVRVIIKGTQQIVDNVVAGQVQLGFVGGRIPHPHLEYRPMGRDRLVLAVPASSRWSRLRELDLDDFRTAPLVIREPGSGTRMGLESLLAQHDLSLEDCRVITELGSNSAVKEAVKAGLGISFLSDLSIVAERRMGLVQVREIKNLATLERSFFAVFDPRRVLSPLVLALLGELEVGGDRGAAAGREEEAQAPRVFPALTIPPPLRSSGRVSHKRQARRSRAAGQDRDRDSGAAQRVFVMAGPGHPREKLPCDTSSVRL